MIQSDYEVTCLKYSFNKSLLRILQHLDSILDAGNTAANPTHKVPCLGEAGHLVV